MLQLVCLAKCNGLNIQLETPETSSLEDLRETIKFCSSEDRGKVVVASYDRRGLKQTGSGHFSPVGGYHEASDMALIMDTARFKLPPHWVPLEMLWEAMKRIDPETGKPRGFVVLEKAHNLSHRLFTPTASNYRDWPQVEEEDCPSLNMLVAWLLVLGSLLAEWPGLLVDRARFPLLKNADCCPRVMPSVLCLLSCWRRGFSNEMQLIGQLAQRRRAGTRGFRTISLQIFLWLTSSA